MSELSTNNLSNQHQFTTHESISNHVCQPPTNGFIPTNSVFCIEQLFASNPPNDVPPFPINDPVHVESPSQTTHSSQPQADDVALTTTQCETVASAFIKAHTPNTNSKEHIDNPTPKETDPSNKENTESHQTHAKVMQSNKKQPTNYSQEVISIQTHLILANPNQPRKDFSESAIIKLADSIRQYGIIQPITVRKLGHQYELIAGERRLRAIKELGWTTIPCIVANVNDEKSAEISIIENLQREDLNIFEQAIAIESLMDIYGLTQEQIAEKLSSSQSNIANKLRLLRFTPQQRELITKNKLTERHARAILRINDQNLQNLAIETVISNELNVSSTEELVRKLLGEQEIASKTEANTKPFKDVTSFYKVLIRALDNAKTSNLDVKCRKIANDSYTEITILIPKEKQNSSSEEK